MLLILRFVFRASDKFGTVPADAAEHARRTLVDDVSRLQVLIDVQLRVSVPDPYRAKRDSMKYMTQEEERRSWRHETCRHTGYCDKPTNVRCSNNALYLPSRDSFSRQQASSGCSAFPETLLKTARCVPRSKIVHMRVVRQKGSPAPHSGGLDGNAHAFRQKLLGDLLRQLPRPREAMSKACQCCRIWV